jgi:hypothetical protein
VPLLYEDFLNGKDTQIEAANIAVKRNKKPPELRGLF